MKASDLDWLCLRTASAHFEAIAAREDFRDHCNQCRRCIDTDDQYCAMRDVIKAICRSALATHEEAQKLRAEVAEEERRRLK